MIVVINVNFIKKKKKKNKGYFIKKIIKYFVYKYCSFIYKGWFCEYYEYCKYKMYMLKKE